jgi:hypothetical protein
MTTKKPAVKSVPAFNVKTAAAQVASFKAQGDSFTAKANETAAALHKHCKKSKITVGTMKSDCVIMAAFVAEASKYYDGKVLENLCSTFRKAVNTGSDFSHNPNRKKSGAKTTKSAESVAVVKLTIVKDSDINEVAQGLREALEGKREQYAELVAFLIDAIDEFEGV